MAQKAPIAVRFPDGGTITLDVGTWQWSAGEGDQAGLRAGMANCVLYDYSAADGEPGFRLAQMVAEQLGGEAVLPDVPPGDPDEIH